MGDSNKKKHKPADKSNKAKSALSKKKEPEYDLKSFLEGSKTAWSFLVKHKAIFLILIPIFLSIFFRVQPAYLPVTEDWARSNVYDYYKNSISAQINQQYPNLPQQNRQVLIDKEFQSVLEQESSNIDNQVRELASSFRSRFQDDTGQTYLLAIDPYLWYGLTKNYVEYGVSGNKIENGEVFYTLRGGRFDKPAGPNIHAWSMAQLYKIMHIFDKDTTVLKAVFYFPVILCTLALIPAFFLGQRFSGSIGAFFTATIVAIHPAVLGRTAGGFSDTDAYNIFYPLFIVWFFVEAFETKKRMKKYALFTLSGLFMSLYAISWGGWWHLPLIILGSIGIFLGRYVVLNWERMVSSKKISKIKLMGDSAPKSLVFILYFFVSSLVIYMMIRGVFHDLSMLDAAKRYVGAILNSPISYLTYKAVAVSSIWPNVLTTVAELNLTSVKGVLGSIGGIAAFWISLIGVILLTINKQINSMTKILFAGSAAVYLLIILNLDYVVNRVWFFVLLLFLPIAGGFFIKLNEEEDDKNIYHAVLLIIWMLFTIYASTNGIRFVALLVAPFAIGYGAAIGTLHKIASDWISKSFDIPKALTRTTLLILVLLLLISPIKDAYATSKQEVPSFTDAWYESLQKIKHDADDGIITSWWDFGHWFVAMGERRVTFDGGSQGNRIYWVGNLLLTDDEDRAVDVLRMLNCGQNNAYRTIENHVGKENQLEAINMVNEILSLEPDEAEQYMEEKGLPADTIEIVLEYTHCEDLLPQYLIASEDMIGKSGVWAHFGSWDFTRAAMFNRVNNKDREEGVNILIKDFGLSETEADKTYYEIQTNNADQWVTDWPSYSSGESPCAVSEDMLQCQNGVRFNLETGEATIPTQEGVRYPQSLSYLDSEGEFRVQEYQENTLDISAAIYPRDSGYYSILMRPELVASIFTRTYFFGGAGLEHFEPLDHRTTVTGLEIFTYKVDWDGDPEENEEQDLGSDPGDE